MRVHIQAADRATQAVSERLQDSRIPAATADPVWVDDILQIPEVLFGGKDLLKTADTSSAESNSSGLCYGAVQHWIFFNRLGNLDLKTEDEQEKAKTGWCFAFINNVGFM